MKLDSLGILIAGVLTLGGLALIAFPQEMTVYHPGEKHYEVRGRMPIADRITPFRSYLYGGSLLLVGLSVGVLSLYSPRRKK